MIFMTRESPKAGDAPRLAMRHGIATHGLVVVDGKGEAARALAGIGRTLSQPE
ncbi:MAG: hypothetical protein KAF27_06525 [Porphyrobacter sp.]|nr:hypothetical protein [Porphyrobacter sp.]